MPNRDSTSTRRYLIYCHRHRSSQWLLRRQWEKPTDFDEYLTDHDVTEEFIVGLENDCSITNTARDAQKLGYQPHVILEGIGLNANNRQKTLDEIKSVDIEIVHAADITK